MECVKDRCSVEEASLLHDSNSSFDGGKIVSINVTAVACAETSRRKMMTSPYVSPSNGWSIVASVFVVQRLAYKVWARNGIGMDDVLIALALIIGMPSILFNGHFATAGGADEDQDGGGPWRIFSYDSIVDFCRLFFITEVIYFVSVVVIKLSVLFFYLRIFPDRRVRYLLWGTLLFTCLFGGAFILLAVFRCRPVDYNWLQWETRRRGEGVGRCLDADAIARSNAIVNILLDVWMLVIPVWQLKDLSLDWKRKAGVGAMFAVGTLSVFPSSLPSQQHPYTENSFDSVIVVSVLRLRAYHLPAGSPNPTWDLFDIGIWSVIENDVGIIGACMPSLRVTLKDFLPRLASLFRRGKGTNTGDEPEFPRMKTRPDAMADVKRLSPPLAVRATSPALPLDERGSREFQLVYLCGSKVSLGSDSTEISQMAFIVAPCKT
ncbi:hypothetical protein CP533_3804 [Ophiocordyceps camponoti-saundersi (nom. inval.)]|nr:hypothetical protein CP533_3804 [Ophiocordyceps camponoti-saundersi (nom. inval.)]